MKFLLKVALLVSLGFFSAYPADAQDPAEAEAPAAPTVEMVIPGLQPPTKNIFFIVDTSGSMDGKKVEDAIQTTIQIAETPMDDLQIAIVSFGSGTHRWPGTRDVDPDTGRVLSREGWSLMPSRDNLDAARAWLNGNRDSGSTELLPALQHAFSACAAQNAIKDVSIIIISDGLINNYRQIAACIEEQQRAREENNLPPTTLGFFGIDIQNEATNNLVKRLVGHPVGQSSEWDADYRSEPDTVWEPTRCVLGYFRLVYPPEPELPEEVLPDFPGLPLPPPPPPLPPGN